MRILFVSHYALPHLGGVEVAIDALARELTRRGHDVVHFAADVEPRPTHESEYRVLRLPAANHPERSLGVPWPIFHPRAAGALRAEVAAADVVHAHGFLYLDSVASLLLARSGRAAPRRPVRVLTEHVGHVPYESPVLDRTEAVAIATIGRMAARTAEAIVTYNGKVAAEMARLAPSGRFEAIPNGVDTDRFSPSSEHERAALRHELGWDAKPRVLFVARLVAKKGVQAALAAAAVDTDAFRLLVVGPDRLPPPQPSNVESLGPLPTERLATLYRAADAFLLPSRGEGFPLTAQEAMASGLPVLLGDDPEYRSHIDGAGRGVQLVSSDGRRIAGALRDLLTDPAGRAEAGGMAAAHARRSFSWGRAVDSHEALYDELAQRRSRGASIGAGRRNGRPARGTASEGSS